MTLNDSIIEPCLESVNMSNHNHIINNSNYNNYNSTDSIINNNNNNNNNNHNCDRLDRYTSLRSDEISVSLANTFIDERKLQLKRQQQQLLFSEQQQAQAQVDEKDKVACICKLISAYHSGGAHSGACCQDWMLLSSRPADFASETSLQIRAKVIWINLIGIIVNLGLALAAFYFAFVNNSSATSAFAADCLLDLISSAIVLWRYVGNLTSEYAKVREQIACIYLGALFEFSGIAIILKAIKDIVWSSSSSSSSSLDTDSFELDLSLLSDEDTSQVFGAGTKELVYLATAATFACLVLAIFKWTLYRQLRDHSILLDVVNTIISSIFALSILLSQALISNDSILWYLDHSLSIVLALFMLAFGLRVLMLNLTELKRPLPSATSQSNDLERASIVSQHTQSQIQHRNYGSNLALSFEQQSCNTKDRERPGQCPCVAILRF